jgi:hypothetical protein
LLAFQASRLATDFIGDSIATNVLMVGYAVQKGLLPLSVESIQEAIRLNGTFVEGNLRTFALGRLAAHSPDAFAPHEKGGNVSRLDTIEEILASRIGLLTDYQDAAYAKVYEDFMRAIEGRVQQKKLSRGATAHASRPRPRIRASPQARVRPVDRAGLPGAEIVQGAARHPAGPLRLQRGTQDGTGSDP